MDLSDLFHPGHEASGEELLTTLLSRKEGLGAVAMAALAELLIEDQKDRLPEVEDSEIQALFEEICASHDAYDEREIRHFLRRLDVEPEEVVSALELHLRLRRFVEEFAASAGQDATRRNGILWELFATGRLEPLLSRTTALKVRAASAPGELPVSSARAGRSYIAGRLGVDTWEEAEATLTERLGMTRQEANAEAERHGWIHLDCHIQSTPDDDAEPFDRHHSPEEAVERLLSVKEQFGITRVAAVQGLDDFGVPVHSIFRPRSRSVASVHSGKGVTEAQSLASGLAEAIEVDCAERFLPDDRVENTFAALSREHRVFRPTVGIPSHRAIRSDMRLTWAWAENLLAPADSQRGLLPIEFVLQGHLDGQLFDVRMSHGLGLSLTLDEAGTHGLLELIERDAVAAWSYRVRYCGLDPRARHRRIASSSLRGEAAELLERVHAADCRVWLVDLTTDIQVPVVGCLIQRQRDGRVGEGYAAHLHAMRAARGAMLEAIQTFTVNVQGSREDLQSEDRPARYHQLSYVGWERPHVRAFFQDETVEEVPVAALPSTPPSSFGEGLNHLLARLRKVGIRHAYRVDLSTPDCRGFHVVRMVVPELELTRLDTVGPRRLRHLLE